MKRIIVAVVSALLVSFSAAAEGPGTLVTGAVAVNPTANQVLVDTGAISCAVADPTSVGQFVFLQVSVAATVGAFFRVNLVDQLGVTQQSVFRGVPVNGSADWQSYVKLSLLNGWKIQVAPAQGVVGQTQASITWSNEGCF